MGKNPATLNRRVRRRVQVRTATRRPRWTRRVASVWTLRLVELWCQNAPTVSSVPMTLGCHASSAVAPMRRAAAPFHIITVIYSPVCWRGAQKRKRERKSSQISNCVRSDAVLFISLAGATDAEFWLMRDTVVMQSCGSVLISTYLWLWLNDVPSILKEHAFFEISHPHH